MDGPRTAALANKFVRFPGRKFIRVYSLEQLQTFLSSSSFGDVGDIPGLTPELKKIPVQQ
jgi:hypothetical protein